jgi:hypothetical protein
MAKILSVASSEVLRTTRQLLLEQQGFAVCSALTVEEVPALGKEEKVDLALIGHGFRGPDKREIAHIVNHYFPACRFWRCVFIRRRSQARILFSVTLPMN